MEGVKAFGKKQLNPHLSYIMPKTELPGIRNINVLFIDTDINNKGTHRKR